MKKKQVTNNTSLKKNDRINATCLNYTNEGMGVVKVDGYPLFVNNIMKDEEANLVVTKVNKNFGFAKVLDFNKTSNMRVEPICPLAKTCGGCQIQHMAYEEQLSFKKQKVQDVMDRIAKIDIKVNDVLGMNDPYQYRNKGQIPVGIQNDECILGFYRIHSNTIIPMDYCHVQSNMINKVMNVMKDLLNQYQNARYFRHILIKHAFTSNEVMVVLIVNKQQFEHQDALVKALIEKVPEIKTVILNLNQRNDNVILGEKEWVLYGDGKILEQIDDLKFKISSKSFFQVNPLQTKVLYGKALEYAQLTGNELVVDLYCGVGSISLFLARSAKKVIGVEIVEAAIEDAKENAKLNNIHNCEFVCSDAANYASFLSQNQLKPDVIVIDPPRKGCDQITIDSIVAMNPERVVYVSCDPATLARDLNIFESKGYKTIKVQPVDMFPHSAHVETVCLLERK